jgi:hypothetical protein
MAALFASGRMVDLVLALTLIEAVALVAWHRRTGGGVAPGDFLGNLLSGVCLLVALRLGLAGAWWGWIALALLAALAAHLTDLASRWRSSRR